jgi:hypothetical protein
VVEAGGLVQRRNGAAEVRRDGTAGVTDEEGEVELTEDGGWQDGRVARFLGDVSVGSRLGRALCLSVPERWSNVSFCAVGGDNVVDDVLDEDAFVLWLY